VQPQKTHREIKTPQISGRYLADFMAASERGKRTITQRCKYQAIARVIQHDEAKITIAKFIRDGNPDLAPLIDGAQRLRDRIADSDFDRDLFDHNAEYITRFTKVVDAVQLPDAEIIVPGRCPAIELSGVKVTADIQFRFRRLTRTNKVRMGAAMLRYAKGKALPEPVADWQSAFIFGYLARTNVEEGATPEYKLCITLDAYTGTCHPAPTNSASRFENMDAACASIAERWPNIPPPPGAVI